MSYTCRSCGATVGDNVNYCPSCGALLVVNAGGDSYNSAYNNSAYGDGSNTDKSGVLKTAAIAGGTALGVSALTGLARNLTHRRRPPYMGMGCGMHMGPPPGGMGGPGGPQGPGGRF